MKSSWVEELHNFYFAKLNFLIRQENANTTAADVASENAQK